MTMNQLAAIVCDLSYKIHTKLGPGILESAYEACLFHDIQKLGIEVDRQKPMPLVYDNVKLDTGYRLDLILENKLVVEIKSVEGLNDLHFAQTLTYLRLSQCKLGLLINFNTTHLKSGIRRIVNGL